MPPKNCRGPGKDPPGTSGWFGYFECYYTSNGIEIQEPTLLCQWSFSVFSSGCRIILVTVKVSTWLKVCVWMGSARYLCSEPCSKMSWVMVTAASLTRKLSQCQPLFWWEALPGHTPSLKEWTLCGTAGMRLIHGVVWACGHSLIHSLIHSFLCHPFLTRTLVQQISHSISFPWRSVVTVKGSIMIHTNSVL